MKRLLLLLAIFCTLRANAQNYLISFTGTGESITVNTIKVENLTKGTSLIVNGSDILHLTSILTGVNSIKDNQLSEIKIYPNPMTDNSTIEINPPVAGEAVITICEMTGIPVAQIQSYLEISRQDFRISGLGNGFYLINVKGNGYQFSGKLICNAKPNGTIKIERVNNKIEAVDEKAVKTDSKGTQTTIDMAYTTDDRLKFTGISGNYSTVVTDIPASDKTVNFNFITCTDGDNNNYPIVVIGEQTWMAENLKTSKYNDLTPIPLITDNGMWIINITGAYCDYENNSTNSDTYGKLYNWYVGAYNNMKNVCPIGWHVPSNIEWGNLYTYMNNSNLFYDNIADIKLIGKSLAAKTFWAASTVTGAVGNIDFPEYRNKTGFTALPAGVRVSNGTFTGISSHTFWWSTNQYTTTVVPNLWGLSRTMDYDRISLVYVDANGKDFGYSVRCLRD